MATPELRPAAMSIASLILTSAIAFCPGTGDDRAYCEALRTGDPGRCYSVLSTDRRMTCRAQVLRDPSICMAVTTPWRADCLARARWR